MPILPEGPGSPPLIEPSDKTEIARYLSLAKLISLLKNKQIFLCRLDKLEDKNEGVLTNGSVKQMVEEYKYLRDTMNYFTNPSTDEEYQQKAEETVKFRERTKPIWCVNCWNKYASESYALWKIYGASDQGIMIKTSYEKLKKALAEEHKKIYCSEVVYKNYLTDTVPSGNMIVAVYTKDVAYEYENEIRLIYSVDLKNGWDYDWSKEEYENGVMANIDIQELIGEIIISPFAPSWFFEIVEDIVRKYSLDCSVSRSRLRINS